MLEAWQISLIVAGSSLFGTLIGAGIAYLTNQQRLRVEARRHWNDEVIKSVMELVRLTHEMESETAMAAANPSHSLKTSEILSTYQRCAAQETSKLAFITPQAVLDAAMALTGSAVALRMDMQATGRTTDATRVDIAFNLYTESFDELRRQVKSYVGIREPRLRRRSKGALDPIKHMTDSISAATKSKEGS